MTDSDDDIGGTEQVRLAFKGPALQTLPPSIQDCMTARRPDWGIWSMDLAQIEMRVPAVYCGEPRLIDAFERGADLHSDQAIIVFGADWLSAQLGTPHLSKDTKGFKPYRDVGKGVNFSSQFWAAASTMQEQIFKRQMFYVEMDKLQRSVDARPTYMPVLYAWQMSQQKEATGKGYLDIPLLGITRTFVGGSLKYQNVILNTRVQGGAAATLLDIQHRLHYKIVKRRLPWIIVNLQVHDALKGEYDRSRQADLEALIKECVEETATRGYWGVLQSRFNRKVPLDYELETH